MFEGFTSHTVPGGNGLEIAAVKGGAGPPLLLLHGYPQTRACWRKIAGGLARRFTVVAADLRGYGASSKPPGGGDHAVYSKRAMAADQVALMRALGFPRFRLVGHDRGGRVAHRLALDHPDAVERLAVLDICPTATMFAATNQAFATSYYHWFFLIQPADLPERMIANNTHAYIRQTIASWCKTEGAFDEAILRHYVEAYFDPAAIHGACEDYRAAAGIDLVHDMESDAAGHKLTMPVLALWGGRGTVGRMFDVLATWREKSTAPVTGHALDCGHFLAEEAPEETLKSLLDFL
ncbi:alpha/beta hydrolase [Hyphomicrobium sp.]|uniref:alpha/beta fold hydrolase n=1 Tax=Hyphomicrobium sp. TaxID=82 RepID=UPI0025BCE5BE|nr:alpha/beta hydrolase [Hyphomicrobium sp.]MCC7250815.1 alpha/beta hydrolase [Hyphomicrobium sp.]